MKNRPLVVPHWTGAAPLAMPEDGLLVFSLTTPLTRNRDSARQQVRDALRATLAPLLGYTPEAVPLRSHTGQPLRLDVPEGKIGLSVSHEAGLSLLAIHLHGPVGIDLLRVADLPVDDTELQRLSMDYCGEEAPASLATLPKEARRQAFAQSWVKLEASLKCLGEGLTEWSPERQVMLADCRIRELALPEGMVGAVAQQIRP